MPELKTTVVPGSRETNDLFDPFAEFSIKVWKFNANFSTKWPSCVIFVQVRSGGLDVMQTDMVMDTLHFPEATKMTRFVDLARWNSLCLCTGYSMASCREAPLCHLASSANYTQLKDHFVTLILLTWKIWWANNASKWHMWFNSEVKGLILIFDFFASCLEFVSFYQNSSNIS